MSKALVACQREDGLWNPSLVSSNYEGKELTGTGLFLYGLSWGINNKILKAKDYQGACHRAWKGLINDCVHRDGFLGYVQGTGKDPLPDNNRIEKAQQDLQDQPDDQNTGKRQKNRCPYPGQRKHLLGPVPTDPDRFSAVLLIEHFHQTEIEKAERTDDCTGGQIKRETLLSLQGIDHPGNKAERTAP